ncbi:MAG: radical SAM protein [Endomicrobiaceae bacterium]|nr:radical SAM protein [Endomicrobiaceae bacterium]
MKKLKTLLKNKIPILAEVKPFFEKLICGHILDHLEFHVTEHCNLNCKGCTHFSNIADEKFTDCLLIQKRLAHLNKIFGKIRKIKILGGEPLLHPEISEILKITRKTVPFADIMVITNGILLQTMPDYFFKTCIENNIIIEITVYPPLFNYLEKITKKLDSLSVKYTLSNKTFSFCGVLNPTGTSPKHETFLNCTGKFCSILKDDNIYMCAIAAYIGYFNKKFNTVISEGKGINIFNHTPKEILKYLKKPEETCRYCTNDFNYFKWETSKNPKPCDWSGKI